MLTTTLLALAIGTAAPAIQEEPSPQDCSYDLDAMLALDRDAFDQDMDGGWRPLAMKGCNIEAAELLRDWRHQKRDHSSMLYWHEAQLRAMAGQTEEAIGLMKLTYTRPDLDAAFGWNFYVSGSIAFLERDRSTLREMMARLAEVPEPDETSVTTPDGTVIKLQWPPNLNVLQAFDTCWDEPYATAYRSPECKAAAPSPTK